MRLVVISGRSGSGKSTALHVLEDVGFNCIDNLPASLLPELVKELSNQPRKQNLAVGIDARNALQNLQQFPLLLEQVQLPGIKTEVLFLDAASPRLIQRFSETRRKHPLSDSSTDLKEAIALEREFLDPIANCADITIDTTNLTLHQLRDLVTQRIAGNDKPGMALMFVSFGFKHGIPVDVDLVFDVRCLPNPYWRSELREYTGLEEPVIEFLQGNDEVEAMIGDISGFLKRWLPEFSANNRSYFTVAIGCTGGQHRSVYICERVFENFRGQFTNTQRRHRELFKPKH